jgi:hypothetical protein
MKHIKKMRDKYNNVFFVKLLDYCNQNKRFLSNVLLNSKELYNLLTKNKIRKVD